MRAILAQEHWIIEGSYLRYLDEQIVSAEHVLLLDTPRVVCLWRLLKRHWTSGERVDLPNGCKDRLSFRCVWRVLAWNCGI